MGDYSEAKQNDSMRREEALRASEIRPKMSTDDSDEYIREEQAVKEAEAEIKSRETEIKNQEAEIKGLNEEDDQAKFDRARKRVWEEDRVRQQNAAEQYRNLKNSDPAGKDKGLSYGSKLGDHMAARIKAWHDKWKHTPEEPINDPYFKKLQEEAEAPDGVNNARKPYAQAVLQVLNGLNYDPKSKGLPESAITAAGKYAKPGNRNHYEEEWDQLLSLKAGLDKAEKDLDRCLIYSGSDDPEFRQFYGELKDMQLMTDSLFYGMLQVPADDAETLDGKKIHRIRNTAVGEDGKEKILDPPVEVLPGVNFRTWRYWSPPKSTPLFCHIPCPEDIRQGMGDCYMMASLAAVAAQDPMKIMEAMHDNEDGTVTVRFFNDDNEPVFVTVNKTIPIEKVPGGYSDVLARDTLWVQLFEKAYALSGLNRLLPGYAEKAEEGKYIGKYGDIDGGVEVNFLPRLLGIKNEDVKDHTREIWAPTIGPLFGGAYYDYEIEFFHKIEKALEKGSAVTCGIDAITLPIWTTDEGLLKGHAYTLLGVEKDQAGEMYVRIRNPLGTITRGYDENGKPVAVPKNQSIRPGESLLKLRDFESVFSRITIADIDMTPAVKAQMHEADAFMQHYGKAALQACQTILDSDNLLLRTLPFNSPSFNDLRKAAMAAQQKLSEGAPNLTEMQQAVRKLTDAARAYINHRDTNQRSRSREEKQRTVNRYYAAEMLCRLDDFMQINEAKEPALRDDVSMTELHRQALNEAENQSAAKTAMQENMSRKRVGEALNLPLIPPKEDLELMKEHAQQGIVQAAEMRNRQKFIKYSADACYYGAAGKQAAHLSYAAGKKLLDPEKAEPMIRKIEPKVEKILKEASGEELNDWVQGKHTDVIIQHVFDKNSRNNAPQKSVSADISPQSVPPK